MRHLILLLAVALACTTTAQPTWRFHLAFEDGTGARDTIWFVFDTSATIGTGFGEVDYALGEGAVAMDPDGFNVWTLNSALDSTKTIAFPYAGMFPYIAAEIHAFNYTYPITLRWDTALFHAPGLPPPGFLPGAQMQCNYFFGVPELHVFDMMSNDTTTAAIDLFPLRVNIGTAIDLGLKEQGNGSSFALSPNPAFDRLSFIIPQTHGDALIRDISGKVCLRTPIYAARMDLDISKLHPGFYLLQVRPEAGDVRTTSFIKQ